jgi:hypothetical protein
LRASGVAAGRIARKKYESSCGQEFGKHPSSSLKRIVNASFSENKVLDTGRNNKK